MTPLDETNRDLEQGAPAGRKNDFPDQTVDFVREIASTPDAELMQRVRKLSPDMRANVLVELVRRYRDMSREKDAGAEELRNLRFHADRLEKLVLDIAKTGKPR